LGGTLLRKGEKGISFLMFNRIKQESKGFRRKERTRGWLLRDQTSLGDQGDRAIKQ